ncbi:MAG: SPOR domain-containing protein [Candidatus Omnitrophica bacterium]|nr:SPOR domain-containing protein [Candidatus Omnitrophota bacterium]
MERQDSPQLELFSQAGESAGLNRKAHSPFLARIWGYEKTILIMIALFTTGIIAFSLGVERGKKIALNEQKKPLELLQPQSRAVVNQVIVKREEAVKQVAAPFLQQRGAYTIQVASFKTRANAQKEAEFLKKKGFTALIFNKGAYVILCVGNFPNKEAAQPLLSELNKRYGSCSIRRL